MSNIKTKIYIHPAIKVHHHEDCWNSHQYLSNSLDQVDFPWIYHKFNTQMYHNRTNMHKADNWLETECLMIDSWHLTLKRKQMSKATANIPKQKLLALSSKNGSSV